MPNRTDIVAQEINGLKSIIASKMLTPKEKIHAIRQYEHVLSQQPGITLKAIEQIGNVVHNKKSSRTQRVKELQGLEIAFIEGFRETAKDLGQPFNLNEVRKTFRAIIAQHSKIRDLGIELHNIRAGRYRPQQKKRLTPEQMAKAQKKTARLAREKGRALVRKRKPKPNGKRPPIRRRPK